MGTEVEGTTDVEAMAVIAGMWMLALPPTTPATTRTPGATTVAPTRVHPPQIPVTQSMDLGDIVVEVAAEEAADTEDVEEGEKGEEGEEGEEGMGSRPCFRK